MNNNDQHFGEMEAAMSKLRRAMMNAPERTVGTYAFSKTQAEIMYLLQESSQHTSELAAKLHLTAGAITQTVETLVQRGHVERVASELDRRVIQLSLTDEGRKVADELRTIRKQWMRAWLSRLSQDEVRAMTRATEQLADLIEEEIQRSKRETT